MSNSSKKKNSEFDSPAGGPTPDWMRMAASETKGKSALSEENTPEWLKSIQSGQTSGKRPEPADDGMSDLERLLAEEGIDLGAVEEDSPEGSAGMSARDWLIQTSDDELVRNRKGRDEEIDLSLNMPKPKASAPVTAAPPPPPADDDPFAGMSDLERLLMEEGIDMGGVKETRPQGSESMSAREWLIATSDDELVRKSGKDSTIPDLTVPATAKAKSTPAADPKAKATPQPEPKAPPAAAKTTPPPPAPVKAKATPPPADDPFAGMSDLERLLAEEGISTDSVKDERPAASQGMSARDFLMSTSEDELIRKRVGRKEEVDLSLPATSKANIPVASEVEVDLPDWLAENENEAEPATADTSSDEDDLMIDNNDLPDWLKDDSAPSPKTSSPATAEDEEDLPDWLMGGDDEEAAPTPTAAPTKAAPVSDEEEELPDWLTEGDEEEEVTPTKASAPPAVEDDMMVNEEDLPDWLQADPSDSPSTSAAAPSDDDDGELPDWLMAGDDEPAEATPPAPVQAKAAPSSDDEEELPDWLMEGDEEEEAQPSAPTPTISRQPVVEDDMMVNEEDLPDWLQADGADDEEIPSPAKASDDDTFDENDLPDWLTDDDDTPEVAAPSPVVAKAMTPSDDVIDEEGLPDWLMGDDDNEEVTAPPVTSKATASDDDVIDEEGLPDWLMGDDDDSPEIAAPPVTAAKATDDDVIDEEGLPDWLMGDDDDSPEIATPSVTAAKATDDDVIDEEGLPDWLMGDDDDSPEIATPPVTAAKATDDDVIDEEGLPDWLTEGGDDDDSAEISAPPVTAAKTTDDDVIDEEGLPDWLTEGGDDDDSAEISAPPVTASDDEVIDEEGLPDWLKEEADEANESVPSSVFTSIEDDAPIPNDLPDWLREVSNEINEPIVATTPSLSSSDDDLIDDLPDWLQDISEDDDSPIVVDEEIEPMLDASSGEENDLPDWLRDAEEADSVEAAPIAAVTETDDLIDESGVPDWLQEAKDEAASEPAVVDDPYAGMSDLERMLMEEGIDVSGMADERPAESRGMSARDYLLSTSDDELLRRKAGQTQAVDLSSAVAAMTTATVVAATQVVETPAEEEEEVPAWLAAESESSDIEASLTEDEPPTDFAADDLGDSTDLPSWMQEAQALEDVNTSDDNEAVNFTATEPETVSISETTAVESEPDSVEFEPPIEFEQPVAVETKVTPPVVAPTKTTPTIPHKPVTVYQGALPAWLKKLREADQRAQELIQLSPMYVPVPIPTTAPILVAQAVMAVAPTAVSQPTVAPTVISSQPVVATPQRVAPDGEATRQLEEARAAKNNGNLSQAFQAYQGLVNRGTYLDAVISDLQDVVNHDPKNHQGYQLMGDAMMLDGRMQSALEAYRKGLAAL